MIPTPGTTINARINEVFARLEAWHLVLKSDQKGPSPDSRYAYLPKRYLFDTGLLRHFRELGIPSISVLKTRSAAARGPLGVIVSFAPFETAEIGVPKSRRTRRIVMLPGAAPRTARVDERPRLSRFRASSGLQSAGRGAEWLEKCRGQRPLGTTAHDRPGRPSDRHVARPAAELAR